MMREVQEAMSKLKLTAIDRALMPISPRLVEGRLKSRARIMAATGGLMSPEARRVHKKSKKNKSSANEIQLGDQTDVQAVSLDLVTTSALPRAIVATHTNHTVGPGLRLDAQPDGQALGLAPEAEAEMSRQMEAWWQEWSATSDWSRELQSFEEMQQVVFGSELILGDMLVLAVDDFDNLGNSLFTTRLQLIEAHRISNPNRATDTAQIAGGVERDDNGRITAYHVCSGYPEGYGSIDRVKLEWERIPLIADNGRRYVYHVVDPLLRRPGQNRGVPLLTPVLSQLKQLSDMTEAELTASVLAACLAVFRRTLDGEIEVPTEQAQKSSGDDYSFTEFNFGPGMIMGDLMPGEEVGSIANNRPNTAFAAFHDAIIEQIAAGTDLSKEVLTRHFSASYSASRGALGEVWRGIIRRRETFNGFCQWAYGLMLDEAVERQYLDLAGYALDPMKRRAWSKANWVGPPMPQMNEELAAKAAAIRIANRLSTRKEETNKLTGGDYNTNHRQLRREREQGDEAVLVEHPAPAATSATSPSQNTRPNETDEGD